MAINKAIVEVRVLRVRAYPVLREAVERGAAYGWRRAFKHADKPTDDAAIDAIADAVMNEICERFDFPEDDNERDVVRARLAALAARPLLCAACSRQLSIALGTAPDAPDGEGDDA